MTMAKVINNIFVRGLSGQVGGQFVIRRLRDGRTIVCKSPDFSSRKLSEAQKEHHRRVKAAAAYARSASRSNPLYAQLAEGTMKNAYNVAFGDWFHPPVIERLGWYGTAIRIWATDDVQVAGVQVLVLDENGEILEQGAAVQGRGDWWEYIPAAAGKVVVEARDLPGNKVQAELENRE
jgi:hypothetical protein